jgi:hypothetical protein
MTDKDYPIDFVVTWVNEEDSEWLALRNKYMSAEKSHPWNSWTMGEKRFRDWGLLPYWFRGVAKFAPWVRNVYLVTAGAVPSWLDVNCPNLRIIHHEDFIPTKYLPTFNSHTIEWNLHRIDGLSEQFVYFNDDMYLTSPTKRDDFFRNGLPRDSAVLGVSFLSRVQPSYVAYSAMLLNEHFDMHKVIKKHPSNWINPKYGLKNIVKTITLLPQNRFPGMSTDHLPFSLLKETYCDLWNLEPQLLDKTCNDRFRQFFGLTPWLLRDWQCVEGKFVPRRSSYGKAFYGKSFSESDEYLKTVVRAITSGRYKVVCVNDDIDNEDRFEVWGETLRSSFQIILPEKSAFEK